MIDRIHVIGSGRVGSAVAARLSERGVAVRGKSLRDQKLGFALRVALLKASDDATFESPGDGRFCWNSEHKLGLRLVCDAVVLGLNRST